MNQLEVTEHLSWRERILPEVLWIGVAIKNSGGGYGKVWREVKDLIEWTKELGWTEKTFAPIYSGHWVKIQEKKKEVVKEEVRKGRWTELSTAAEIMRRVYGERYFAALANGRGKYEDRSRRRQQDIEIIMETVYEGHDKRSKLGVFLHGIIVLWLSGTKKMILHPDMANHPRLWEEALKDPTTEDGEHGASSLRATVMAFFKEEAGAETWTNYFWKKNRRETYCVTEPKNQEVWDEETWDAFQEVQKNTTALVRGCARYMEDLGRLEQLEVDPNYRTIAEGLTHRCFSIFMGLGMSPLTWTATSAPMALRPMVEAYIDFMYMSKEPAERAQLYIDHGQGQEKLAAHHAEDAIRKRKRDGMRRIMERRVEIADEIIQARKADWATDVVTGDWAGNSVRHRALKAGLEPLYTGAYQPWSNASHNGWTHVLRFNSDMCLNPLHLTHGVGKTNMFWTEWNPDYMYRACKYLEMITDLYWKEMCKGEGGMRIRKAFVDLIEKYWGEWLIEEEKEDI